MPKIDSFRIINVDYDNKTKKINDLYIEMSGKNTNIIIANGSGKTFIISLLFQTIIPGQISAEGRTFETMLKDIEGTAHITLCHILDNNKKLITGFVAKKAERINYYNYTIEIPYDYTLKDIEYVKENGEVVEYNEFREYLERNKKVYNIRIFGETLKSEYRKYLETYRIFKSEWEMMARTNRIEGGVSEFISSGARKSTEKLLSQFIIPNITYSLKRKKSNNEIAEAFKKQIDNIKNLPIWEKQIEDSKRVENLFKVQVEKLEKLYQTQIEINKKIYTLFEINRLLKIQKEEYKEEYVKNTAIFENLQNEINFIYHKIENIKNGYLLYQLKNNEKKLKKIEDSKYEYERLIEEEEEKISLKKALDEYLEYCELENEINVIDEEIKNKSSNKDLKREIKKVSSKLYDYYDMQIKELNKKLRDLESNIYKLEVRRDKVIKIISEKNNRIKTLVNDIKYLERKLSEINKIIEIKKIKTLDIQIEEIKNKVNVIQEKISEININIKTIDNDLIGNTSKKENLVEKIKELKDEYEKFKELYNDIDALKKLYGVKTFKVLYIEILENSKKLLIEKESISKKITAIDILMDRIKRDNYIPIPESIEKLDNYLQEKNFYDYTTGYKLLRDGIEHKNPILLNSIIVEKKDIKKLSEKLRKYRFSNDIIFIQNRENLANYEINDSIYNSGIQIIMNDYHKFVSGEISIEELYERYKTDKEKLEKELESISEEYNRIKEYQDIVIKFENLYGKNDIEKDNEFQERIKVLEKDKDNILLKISKLNSEKAELINEKSRLETEIKEISNKLNQLLEKQMKIRDIRNTLNDRFGIDIFQINEFNKKLYREKESIDLKLLELNKELEKLKEEKRYISAEKDETFLKKSEYKSYLNIYEKGIWKYENEDIYELSSRYEYLIQQIDTKELYKRKEKLQKKLNNKLQKIKRYKYELETLENLKNAELKDESYYRSNIRRYRNEIGEFNREIGKIEAEIKLLKKDITNFEVEEIPEEKYIILKEKFEKELSDKKENLSVIENQINALEKNIERLEMNINDEEKLLQPYEFPGKQIITNLSVFQKEHLHNNFIAVFQELKDLENTEKKKREEISDGWQKMKLLISEEGFDLIVNMGFLYERNDFQFNYETAKNLYITVKDLIEKKINTLKSYKEKAMRFKNEMIKNILSEVSIYMSALKKLSKYSEIYVEDRKIETIKIIFNKYNEEEAYSKISEYIDEIIKHITDKNNEKFKSEEEITKYINISFSIFNLLKVVNNGPIKIKILKPDKTFENPRWYFLENVSAWSGGEKFFAFFSIYISIVKVLKNNIGGNMVVISDNPFGKASSEHILSPLMILMKKNNAQFITFTAHNDMNISRYFNYNYSLVLVKNKVVSNNILKIARKEHKETFEKGYYVEW
ncbi:hypothetical protein XO10_01465 [Marinitoga sp. 1135]|uniref:hypothetical protein n=1 Tax=unclassified Marinitoga TaxID=2640159 RepID=UPI0009506B59|nr:MULTISPECIES: hypothetical protein [unclassified Marinitoga]APT75198.1 hypothetical protein LN42_01410 [Marinitoga sp. 1137]NUU94986.1 hypothetical protein [Marinitoga sp. 1135]NUU96942.1 hypothetical protein [Marinitoga sp. 1138]